MKSLCKSNELLIKRNNDFTDKTKKVIYRRLSFVFTNVFVYCAVNNDNRNTFQVSTPFKLPKSTLQIQLNIQYTRTGTHNALE